MPAIDRKPVRTPAVKIDTKLHGGWDLREVEDDFLIGELIRRGYRAGEGLPQPKVATVKGKR